MGMQLFDTEESWVAEFQNITGRVIIGWGIKLCLQFNPRCLSSTKPHSDAN